MNYIQKAPELLREAKTKKPKYIKPKDMVSSDEFATNVTAEMRDRLIKDVLSKHKNWRKATGEEKKEIVAEVADFFNDNYPQVFKKKSIPLLQRIRAKLKRSAKPVTESVDDDMIKLLDKYSAKYHNMKQWELANAIYELKENISYNYEQAEKEEDANNY
ncbi:MAG: hypothetical protein J6W64_07920 [Bacilli bacterium]|nr:hypothetical protein [Bacilli bacterium]